MTKMTIGRLAEAAGVHVETIRYYQRRGLLPEPDKPIAGYRRYPAATIKRVRFIRRAQTLGFTLDEVGRLLELDDASVCADTRDLAAHKLQVIDGKLADLRAMRKSLAALLHRCDEGARSGHCPIIDALTAD